MEIEKTKTRALEWTQRQKSGGNPGTPEEASALIYSLVSVLGRLQEDVRAQKEYINDLNRRFLQSEAVAAHRDTQMQEFWAVSLPRHKLTAQACPPQSEVVLLSALHRLREGMK